MSTYAGDTLTLTPMMVFPGSIVRCNVEVDDGFFGIVTDSIEVEIANYPPILSAVDIQYTDDVTSTSLLTCEATGSDPDLQAYSTFYTWQNDSTGNTLPSTTDTLQLTPSLVSPNDIVSCTITLNDSQDDSNTITETVTVTNTPPTFANNASIASTGTQVGDTWTCTASGTDQDDGSIIPTYTWQDASGNTVGTGDTIVLSPLNSEPNEVIFCIATLTDSQGLTISDSTSAIVTNTPPIITSVSIDQSDVFTDDIISATVAYSDADANNDTSLQLDWYITDETGVETLVQSGPDNTLDGTIHFSKQDTIRVEAVTDSFTSATLSSALVTVQNSPPVVSTLSITPDPAYADYDALTCTVQTNDPDGDTLAYTFTWTSSSGLSQTSTPSAFTLTTLDMADVTPEDWTCSVVIDDGDTTTSDLTTITVEPSACDGISCGPDGTCTNNGSTYTCTCRTGFEGTNCELDIDECAVNNGGCTGTRSDCINTMGVATFVSTRVPS